MSKIMFYSAECSYCEAMLPLINDLIHNNGIEFELIEVTDKDPDSIKKYEECDGDKCGGVPYFFDTNNHTFLCGEIDDEEFKDWALS